MNVDLCCAFHYVNLYMGLIIFNNVCYKTK